MSKYEEAIKAIKNNYPPSNYTILREGLDLAIEALEKQAFFENEVSNIHEWFVDNKDELWDSAMSVKDSWFDDTNVDGKMDEVDIVFMVEDMVDVIQRGILNVLSTYRG